MLPVPVMTQVTQHLPATSCSMAGCHVRPESCARTQAHAPHPCLSMRARKAMLLVVDEPLACRKVPSRPRIELSAKTGLPKGVLGRNQGASSVAESQQEPGRAAKVGQEAVQPRRRDESSEERRQRKSAVKDAKVRRCWLAWCHVRCISLEKPLQLQVYRSHCFHGRQ